MPIIPRKEMWKKRRGGSKAIGLLGEMKRV
jgi:hypothetical protein